MKNLSKIAFGIVGAMLAHPSWAASFDCTKANTIPEYLICNTPELSKGDDEVGVLYKAAKAKATDQKAFTERTRQEFKKLTSCRDAQCVSAWQSVQKAYYSQALGIPVKPATTAAVTPEPTPTSQSLAPATVAASAPQVQPSVSPSRQPPAPVATQPGELTWDFVHSVKDMTADQVKKTLGTPDSASELGDMLFFYYRSKSIINPHTEKPASCQIAFSANGKVSQINCH